MNEKAVELPRELPRSGFARVDQVLSAVPVGKSTLWSAEWRKKSGFPDPVKLSENVTAWNCEKVWAWLERTEKEAA